LPVGYLRNHPGAFNCSQCITHSFLQALQSFSNTSGLVVFRLAAFFSSSVSLGKPSRLQLQHAIDDPAASWWQRQKCLASQPN
jgi:hypothetical protein